MRLFIILLASLAASLANADDGIDDVVSLNKHNFDAHTQNGHWFIKFYAPWCTFCQKLKPTWQDLAKTAKETKLPVRVAQFDCTTDTEFCKNIKVTGYPTLYFFARGTQKKQFSISGSVSEDDLVDFVKDQLTADGVSLVPTDSQETFSDGSEYRSGLFGFLKYWPTKSFMVNVYLFMSMFMFGLISMCWFFFTYVYFLDEEQHEQLRRAEMANRGELPTPQPSAQEVTKAAEPKKEQ